MNNNTLVLLGFLFEKSGLELNGKVNGPLNGKELPSGNDQITYINAAGREVRFVIAPGTNVEAIMDRFSASPGRKR